MPKFLQRDRSQPCLLPPDMRDWLPEDDLAHFVVEAVERVPMDSFQVNERGTGSAQCHPRRASGTSANRSRSERNSARVQRTGTARHDHSGRSAGSASRRRAASARTSPSAPRADPCTTRCGARSPSSGPPASSSMRRGTCPGTAPDPRTSPRAPPGGCALPPSLRTAAEGSATAPAPSDGGIAGTSLRVSGRDASPAEGS